MSQKYQEIIDAINKNPTYTTEEEAYILVLQDLINGAKESKQELNEIYGEPGRSDYTVGDKITFTEGGQTLEGEIIHVGGPGQTVTGRDHPTQLQVDAGDGFPHVVYISQIVAR